MTIGIFPNMSKSNLLDVMNRFLAVLKENDIQYRFSSNLKTVRDEIKVDTKESYFLPLGELGNECDVIVSFGGDGTMLNAAYELRNSKAPLMGINLGKLGFLAEFDLADIDEIIKDLKEGRFVIDERITLSGRCDKDESKEMFAINDLVIDKGRWPKMIEISMKVDDNYVSNFVADGLIVATPTGSTGYSLSTGGPIVSPKADAITLSPISPHTLTMRPLVLSSRQKVEIEVTSPYEGIQVNCDGQRVYHYQPPFKLKIVKNENPIRLVHSEKTDYFQILRNKLFWGLDIRKNNNTKG